MHIKSPSVQEKFATQVLFGRIFPPTRSWVSGKHDPCFGRTMCFFLFGLVLLAPIFLWTMKKSWCAPEFIWQVSLQILDKKHTLFQAMIFKYKPHQFWVNYCIYCSSPSWTTKNRKSDELSYHIFYFSYINYLIKLKKQIKSHSHWPHNPNKNLPPQAPTAFFKKTRPEELFPVVVFGCRLQSIVKCMHGDVLQDPPALMRIPAVEDQVEKVTAR